MTLSHQSWRRLSACRVPTHRDAFLGMHVGSSNFCDFRRSETLHEPQCKLFFPNQPPKTRTNRNGQFFIPFIPFIPAKQRKPALNPLNRMERHEMERHEFDMPESMPGTTVPANTDQSPPKTGSLPPETFPPRDRPMLVSHLSINEKPCYRTATVREDFHLWQDVGDSSRPFECRSNSSRQRTSPTSEIVVAGNLEPTF
jgi:hypothetical protein